MLHNSHRRRKKIINLYLLRDCEAKICKRSSNHYSYRPSAAGLEVAFLEGTPQTVPTVVGESEFVGSSSPRIDLPDPGGQASWIARVSRN